MNDIALANALLSALEIIIPKIRDAVKKGEVSPEEQQAVRDRYNSLRAAGDSAFSGPEWEAEPVTLA